MGEVHQGGEGPHWTVVPSKKKRKKKSLVYIFLLELQGVIFLVIFGPSGYENVLELH
jgi:hypothetical protein